MLEALPVEFGRMPPDYYQLFFEKFPGVCALLSPEFRVLAVNAEFEHASMRPRAEVIGRILYEAFPDNPSDPRANGVHNLRSSLERVRREKVVDVMPIQRYDVADPEQGGRFVERHWSPVNTPVLDEHGELRCIIHAVQEVTQVVMLEREKQAEHRLLVQSNVALEAANEELEAFCYSVAHDLRAPLRAIQGFSQALLEDYQPVIDETGQAYLTRVSTAAVRMSELIDDLLTLSRITRGPLSRSTIDLSALARSVAADMDRQYQHGVTLHVADGVVVNADPRLLRIALANLLSNAWKFSAHTAAPRVDVGVEREGDEAVYFVRDNGAGFDETYAAKLFAPFQRLHSDKEFAGTGVGLATVQRIVRRHGGRVWARGAVNRGATISFTLPD